ncbi:MAG: helix-turn-helix transcriptional regulator [Xanthomonadales bacterium]|nr:helix-turn-helix transcriptional regulator [Xanthomonadales bacterium]
MTSLISNEIRRLRFEHNEMTQQALADAIGLTRQTVIAIEKNKYSPSLEAAFKIAEVFGVTLDQVFKYKLGQK